MRIFIDGLNLIRVESNLYIHQIEIENNKINWLRNEGFNQFFSSEKPIDLHLADRIIINGEHYPLEIGIATLTKEFEKKYRYDGTLGAMYTKESTTFKLFSPVAKEVFVVINDQAYPMTYEEPIWDSTVEGDHEGLPYFYRIRLVDTFNDVKDPYAIASNLNQNVIIDWQKTDPIEQTPIQVKNYVDTVIYEGHVRDLSINLDVESKGLFEGVTEHSKRLKGTVLHYVKKLGMTHIQLLPVFDFEGVDDLDKSQAYNWGYNPSQYFVLDGWFSKNPDDPYDRINGFIKLVNHAHSLKLGVNMDVVYNHVFDHLTYPYDHIVPGYFYRHDQKHQMTHACFLDNDLETRNYMVRKLIVDSLSHFAKHYQIDGFRFDLMGLLDIETMLEIHKSLRQINPYIMLYGEGWNMPNEVPSKQRSNMSNQSQFPMVAHFNDSYRNTMKGELHGPGLGYTMGNTHLTNKALDLIIGSPHMFVSPNQSINYVECHDNSTFYDKMLLNCGYENPQFKICEDFANHLIAISQGVPFYHAGQEFYRSKKGVENSYNSPDLINMIHWNIHEEAVKKLKKLLQIRKKYALYRQKDYSDKVSIEKNDKLIVYRLEDKKHILIHYIKNVFGIEKLSLEKGHLIFPSQHAVAEDEFVYVDQPGIYIVHIKK